jgi:hypothetical protein
VSKLKNTSTHTAHDRNPKATRRIGFESNDLPLSALFSLGEKTNFAINRTLAPSPIEDHTIAAQSIRRPIVMIYFRKAKSDRTAVLGRVWTRLVAVESAQVPMSVDGGGANYSKQVILDGLQLLVYSFLLCLSAEVSECLTCAFNVLKAGVYLELT